MKGVVILAQEKNIVYEAYREMLKAITGYDIEFYRNTDTIVKVENRELCFYEDISYHGSPCYEKRNSIPLTTEEFYVLSNLFAMKKDIEKINAEHELKRLKAEKEYIDMKMEEIMKSGKFKYERK